MGFLRHLHRLRLPRIRGDLAALFQGGEPGGRGRRGVIVTGSPPAGPSNNSSALRHPRESGDPVVQERIPVVWAIRAHDKRKP